MTRPTAVVPASRYPHAYASVRSLSEAGVRTLVAVADESVPVAASRFCDEVVEIPPSHDTSAYGDALLELARRPAVETIVPHRPQGPYVLAKRADEFRRHVDLAVPSMEQLRDVHDRRRLAAAAQAAGVPVTETRGLDEGVSWDTDRVVKSRYNLLVAEYVDSVAPGESQIAKSVRHVRAGQSPDVDAIRAKMGHDPIVQEFVPGTEYMVGALYDEGEALATFQHRQLRGDSHVGGGGVYREAVHRPALETAARRLLDELDWHGPACIEYVEDAATGEFKPIEMNPRMWQSLGCATRAGADFPRWYLLQATGNADRIDPGYADGVATHYLFGELEHLVSVARETSPFVDAPSLPGRALEVARTCVERPHFDLLHPGDPGPGLRAVWNGLSGAVGRRLG